MKSVLPALLALALSCPARAEVVIDATGQSFASVQTRFYAALEEVLTQPNGSNCTGKLPLRVKLTGTARCTFADATDYGDVRACLALFASGPYSAGRPTVAAKKFNPVPRGGLVIDLDGLHLEFDAERGGAQSEAVAGLMIGSGYMAGYVGTCSGGRRPGDDCAVDADCGTGGVCAEGTKNMQWGAIPGLRIVGNATIHATAVRSGSWNKRKVPTTYFSDPDNSSPTTFIGLWMNNAPGIDLSDLHLHYQGAGGDLDDLGVACHMTFSALWGTLYLTSGNGVFFGPACMPAIDSMDIESSGIDRFGIILGSPRGYMGPVDDACVTRRCSQRNVGFPGPESSGRVISEGFQTENLVSFVSASTALSLWVEGRPADGHGILIGAGTCQGGAGDGSVCAVLADCPPRTLSCSTTRDLVNAPNSMTLGGSLNASGGVWAFGPGATEPFLAHGAEDVVRVVGDVMLPEKPTPVLVHPNANITIDLSGAAFAQPFLMPASYAGRFIPPRPFITHPGDCTSLTKGVLNQRCESRPDGRVWRCQPDVGGASAYLCDQPADWLPVGQSVSVSARSRSSTLSAADARNTLVTNEGASGPIALVLPGAQRGMCLKLVLVAPYSIEVRPAERERILRDTNAAGDALRSDTSIGSLLELCAVNDAQWAVISKIGAWKDAD